MANNKMAVVSDVFMMNLTPIWLKDRFKCHLFSDLLPGNQITKNRLAEIKQQFLCLFT